MKVAVSYDHGAIFAHVGDTKEFKVYEIQDGKVIAEEILATEGRGRQMVVDFLTKHECKVLICNEICGGAKGAVQEAGAEVFGAVTGNADEAVQEYLNHTLKDGETVVCHHD